MRKSKGEPNFKKKQKLEYKLVKTEGQIEYIEKLKASALSASAVKKLDQKKRSLEEQKERIHALMFPKAQRSDDNLMYLKVRKYRIVINIFLSILLLCSIVTTCSSLYCLDRIAYTRSDNEWKDEYYFEFFFNSSYSDFFVYGDYYDEVSFYNDGYNYGFPYDNFRSNYKHIDTGAIAGAYSSCIISVIISSIVTVGLGTLMFIVNKFFKVSMPRSTTKEEKQEII